MVDSNPKRFINFSKPSLEEQKELHKIVEEEKAEVERVRQIEEGEPWKRYMSSNDCSTPDTLFRNPPEKFVGKLSYGDLVYCRLLEDNREEGYLCYLCNTSSLWTVVYIYSGISVHQRHMISSVYGRHDVDWRVVPVTDRYSRDEFSRSNGLDWAVWIFCHYFNFSLFPEP
jgi:hypothetical protein